MRAAKIEEFGKVIIKDVPKPEPGAEEALIRITSAGVCHSDLHLVRGDWIKFFPPGLGHEGIGVVEELGPEAEKYVKKGDRVIFGLGGTAGAYWCGACEYCLSGKPMLCQQKQSLYGALGEYISIWVKALVKLPDEIDDKEAPLACAGLTAFSAIKKIAKFGVVAGKTIAIIGAAGGLGSFAIQIAKAFGFKVVGVDVGSEKLEFIKNMGADFAKEPGEVGKFVKKEFRGGVEACLIVASKLAAFELGLKLVKNGGLFVAVGLPALSEGTFPVLPFNLVLKDITLIGSLVGTVDEMRELVQLAADGKVKTHVGRTANLSEINQVLEELEKGSFTGRAIITDMTK